LSKSRSTMSRKSLSMERSCTSSTNTCVTFSSSLSCSRRFSRIPVVQKSKRVCSGEALESSLTVYPTVFPTFSFLSRATRSATDMALKRLGWATMTLHGTPLAAHSSRTNCGTCVVLPEPVSPSTTVTVTTDEEDEEDEDEEVASLSPPPPPPSPSSVASSRSRYENTGKPRRCSPIGPIASAPHWIRGGTLRLGARWWWWW